MGTTSWTTTERKEGLFFAESPDSMIGPYPTRAEAEAAARQQDAEERASEERYWRAREMAE